MAKGIQLLLIYNESPELKLISEDKKPYSANGLCRT